MTQFLLKNAFVMAAVFSVNLIAHADSPQTGSSHQLQLHTNLIGKNIVGVSSDGKFFAIVCSPGLFMKSTADLLFPNDLGDVVTEDYNKTVVRAMRVERPSAYLPLTDAAVHQVCNHPNGQYTFLIDEDAKSVGFGGGQALDADSGRLPRDF
jgi:hypothetical protein